jgi:hypothetical protein
VFESLRRDLRYSGRTLVRSPGFTTVALLTLAFGIGANSAIFSFVDGVLLKPLAYPNADRIVRVLEKPPRGERNGISTLNFLDWQRDNEVSTFAHPMMMMIRRRMFDEPWEADEQHKQHEHNEEPQFNRCVPRH